VRWLFATLYFKKLPGFNGFLFATLFQCPTPSKKKREVMTQKKPCLQGSLCLFWAV